jgi:2-C-methyl-D-erythritol 4-phosphate cytidylyltransferase
VTGARGSAGTGGTWAVVLAGGGGTRFGGPKQYADLAGRTLLDRTTATAANACDGLVVVLPDPSTAPRTPGRQVRGGGTRAASVRAGLAAVPHEAAIIVVADAAHPLATEALYRRVIRAVEAGADAAIPGLPLTEAVATVDASGHTGTTHAAAGHVLVQTPHAFRAELLRRAHETGIDAVEDSSLVAALGAEVRVVAGDPRNVHVTTPEELDLARRLAAN